MLVGEAAFFGKSFGSEEIGVAVLGEVVDADKPLGNEVLQVGVDQAEGNAQTLGELALREFLVARDLREKEERAIGIKDFFIITVHGLNNITKENKFQSKPFATVKI